MNTIKVDLDNALAIIKTMTTDQSEIRGMLQAAFLDIQRRRAALIAQNASSRIFALSQYEADLQLLTRHDLLKTAFKQLFSSTGDPCPFCRSIIIATQEAPIPFTQAFADLGSSLTVDGKTMNFNYESIIAGNVHPNCRCYYKIILVEKKEDNSAEVEQEKTDAHTQTIVETIKAEIAPLIEKINDDEAASEETMRKLEAAAVRLDDKISIVESKLDYLDKRTKEARQLKEELLEANELKTKLSAAEEYASKLESILDGQS
jgi:hypothetical protein